VVAAKTLFGNGVGSQEGCRTLLQYDGSGGMYRDHFAFRSTLQNFRILRTVLLDRA